MQGSEISSEWEQLNGWAQDEKPEASRSERCNALRSALELRVRDLEAKVEPATPYQVMTELGACLTLAVPSGMTEDDRANWLTVAAMEVRDIPNSYFAQACKHARRTADHPSKIVPAICKFDPGEMLNRNHLARELRIARSRLENLNAPRLEQGNYEPDEALKQGMRKLVEELQAKERTAD